MVFVINLIIVSPLMPATMPMQQMNFVIIRHVLAVWTLWRVTTMSTLLKTMALV